MLGICEKAFKLPVEETYLWSDSQCVLKWIFTDKDLTTFVRNRVTEIKSHKNIRIHFTSTKVNPADIVTRGCSLKNSITKTRLFNYIENFTSKN